MAWRERFYERRLKRPVDDQKFEAIRQEFLRRKHEIPVSTELFRHPSKPEVTIRSKWLSFIVQFDEEVMRVDAELTLAAKMMATKENRRLAIAFIERVAEDLDL